MSADAASAQPRPPGFAVYYAVDDHPRMLFQLRKSIESIRRFNADVPIYVAYAGAPAELPSLEDLHVSVVEIPRASSPAERFFHKWRALGGFSADALLYLDADTEAGADVAELLAATGQEDFHARIEPAAGKGPFPMRVGQTLVRASTVDHELNGILCAALDAAELPMFNAGVMLFKNGFHRRMAERAGEVRRLFTQFARKRIPYPCRNVRLFDQVVGAIVIGREPRVLWAALAPELSPFWVERLAGDVRGPYAVQHIWSANYAAFLLDLHGIESAREYLRLPAEALRGDWFFSLWMRSAVWRPRLPESWLHRWAASAKGLLPPPRP